MRIKIKQKSSIEQQNHYHQLSSPYFEYNYQGGNIAEADTRTASYYQGGYQESDENKHKNQEDHNQDYFQKLENRD